MEKSEGDHIANVDSQVHDEFQEGTLKIINADADANFHESKPTRLLMLVVFVSSVSHLMFGYDTGYISSALVSIGTDLGGKDITNGQSEFITSATSLGAFCGSALTMWLADALGRKRTSIGANVFLVVGAIIQCAAHTVWTMIIGRFIMGWGVGIGSVIAPLYITELSPPKFRGRLVTWASIIRTGAQLVAYGIGAGLSKVPHAGWRILVGISIVPTLAQTIALIWLPDSPRYLVLRNRIDEAEEVIRKTHAGASQELINAKVNELIEVTKEVYPPGTTTFGRFWMKLRDLHRIPSNFRGLIIVCGMQGINQFTGYNSLMYFSSIIFGAVGFSNSTAVSIVVAGTSFVFTVVVYFLIDRAGRRTLMIVSLIGMILSLAANAIAFHFLPIKFEGQGAKLTSASVPPSGIAILVFMMTYVAFFAVGTGAVPWNQSETFPMYVRGLGSSFACCTNWAGSLVIASTFLTMMKNITPTGTFAFFAAISFVSLIFVYFCYPELSNLGLEETQAILTDGFNIKRSVELSKERRRLHKELE